MSGSRSGLYFLLFLAVCGWTGFRIVIEQNSRCKCVVLPVWPPLLTCLLASSSFLPSGQVQEHGALAAGESQGLLGHTALLPGHCQAQSGEWVLRLCWRPGPPGAIWGVGEGGLALAVAVDAQSALPTLVVWHSHALEHWLWPSCRGLFEYLGMVMPAATEVALKATCSLARWLSWLEHRPVHLKFAGFIPIRVHAYLACGFGPQLGCMGEATDWCLSPSLPPPLSKINEHILKWGFVLKSHLHHLHCGFRLT